MKVFFSCSPRSNLSHSRAIYQAVGNLGHKHVTNFVATVDPETFYNVDEGIWEERYTQWLKDIAASEVCLFEVSIHSLAIGQLLQEAISREKPMIALYYQGQRPYFLRGTEGSKSRVQLVEYTLENVKDVLSDAFELATELLTTRFTMLMPSEMTRFLDKINEEEGRSRSEFIRDLIAQEMEKRKK